MKLTTPNSKPPEVEPDSSPPFLRSWRRLYAVVLGELVVLIILFYLFTKAFE
ncbi:MAG: hypothetical protein Q8P51_03485 [Ignavibacteria bacterium]|nr:hypothetical protein [Ignavibacteria bacterium]